MSNSTVQYRRVCVTASLNFNQKSNQIDRPIQRNHINLNARKCRASVSHTRLLANMGNK